MADESGSFVVPAFAAAMLDKLPSLTHSNVDPGP